MNAEIPHLSDALSGVAQHAAPDRDFGIQLSATRRGARLARRLATQQLDAWGWPYDSEASRAVAHLVAELAANAVLHGRVAGRDFRLRLMLVDGVTIRVEVTDPRPDRLPLVADHVGLSTTEAETGRGLHLVRALADRWGTRPEPPRAKTVWCELALQ
ncbi:ATP-binding protein [Streptomyces jeddahensis]|uniref:Histidine kinase/HSP90-like ATPase domain-containing protein n=1 Tax=Streptomyces jeddahensis TaxID=1716141 RepID=A0A177HEP0_9ACTN|nr:ATP-binding protein [Streptomyces jeddahensis]OAH09425.1 hypothetical protein STSP_72770 [Streptomyces jeddahensis]